HELLKRKHLVVACVALLWFFLVFIFLVVVFVFLVCVRNRTLLIRRVPSGVHDLSFFVAHVDDDILCAWSLFNLRLDRSLRIVPLDLHVNLILPILLHDEILESGALDEGVLTRSALSRLAPLHELLARQFLRSFASTLARNCGLCKSFRLNMSDRARVRYSLSTLPHLAYKASSTAVATSLGDPTS
ncbi:hypothetical protein BE221DRAFT_60440, partial [Ostreococcus tauri]